MATRKARSKDLTSIRQRGGSYQVRVFAGDDPVSGQKMYLTGSAPDEAGAVKLRDKFRAQVADATAARTNATLGYLIEEWLKVHDADESTLDGYRMYADRFIIPAFGSMSIAKLARLGPRVFDQFYAELRQCRRRCGGKSLLDHRTGMAHECRIVRHRWPVGRPTAKTRNEHDCTAARCKVVECKPHVCKPLAPSSLQQIHAILSGAFKSAVRWDWIGMSPVQGAVRPKVSAPDPTPPSAQEAARILECAWDSDGWWGTFVCLVMITGARRGELVPLRWSRFALQCAKCQRPVAWEDQECPDGHDLTQNRLSVVTLRKGFRQRNGRRTEKDTKTHQNRRVALDVATTELLVIHWQRYTRQVEGLNKEPNYDAYVFSYAEDHSRPCNPDALTHRYSAMTASLGLDTHLHELRHYSATELLSAGVDLRTVAGRLGHANGGATTLRVYAAWVASADAHAAELLAARLPSLGKKSP